MDLGQILAVISGKGGTGKTSVCAAVAAALAQDGRKVLCIDADVGLRNLDLSLGIAEEPALPFTAVMDGQYRLSDALRHPKIPNLWFLTAPVTRAPEAVDPERFANLAKAIRKEFDFCLIDAPAGVGAGFRLAVSCADRALVVTGADPAALRDGARTAAELERCSRAEGALVVNRIRVKFFQRIKTTVDDCMDTVGLPLLGIVPEDETVALAAAMGKPLNTMTKKGAAAACRNIARRLQGIKQPLLRL